MKRLAFFIILFGFINIIYAQNNNSTDSTYSFTKNSYVEIAGGPTYLFNKEIYNNFDWGGQFNLRLRFDTKNKKFSFSPLFSARSYSESLPDDPDIDNSLQIIKTGLQINYTIFRTINNRFNFSGFLETDYSWIYNDLSWEDKTGFVNPYNKSGKSYEYFHLFSGSNLSMILGLRVRYAFVFVETSFDLLKSDVELSADYKTLLKANNVEYNPTINYNMNSLNFQIGVAIPLNLFGKLLIHRLPF